MPRHVPYDPSNPWLFRLDELDVLEDELDEIFDLHDQTEDPVNRAVEETVIDEQTRTENAYERQLSDLLGPAGLEPDKPHVCEHCKDGGFPDGVSLSELLEQDRDPIYARAYRWATRVFGWSKESYWKFGMRNRDMFRVLVNVYLVPVKIAFGLAEESRDDEHASRIAGLEYDLALTYLSRTRESLGALRAMGLTHSDLEWMTHEADAIEATVRERRARFPTL